MIIERVERPVYTSIESKQRRFRIDESGLVNILSILRKNMYSNPTRIIVQEYANNARDAHKEAGIPEKPIHITCPSVFNPYLKIRDYGNGISPEMIDEVFVAYGCSTKRNSNDYIGGYGIGAKSAFSYCDAFEVTTVYQGIKYIYAAYIDSSDVGEMPLVSQEATDEPSGTLISIPIKLEDLYRVNNAIATVTEYWDVRPTLSGSVNYNNRKVYFNEDNWALMEKSLSYQDNRILYCVEGIPYFFELPSDDDRFTPQLRELAKCPFVVKLKTGDVTISSNRESLVSDEKTLNKIYEVLNEININFRKHVEESINKCDKLTEVFNLKSMYGKLAIDDRFNMFEWNGIKIHGSHIIIPESIGMVSYVHLKDNALTNKKGIKVRWSGSELDFSETSDIIMTVPYIEDKIFNRNQVINTLVSQNKKRATVISLKVPVDSPELQSLGFQYIDWVDATNASTKTEWAPRKKSVRAKYYKFIGVDVVNKKQWSSQFDSISEIEEGVYFPIKGGVFSIDGHQTFFHNFSAICKQPIYGISVRNLEDAENNENLTNYLEFINDYCDHEYKVLQDNIKYINKPQSFMFRYINKFLSNLPEDHIIKKYINLHYQLINSSRLINREMSDRYKRWSYLVTFSTNKYFLNTENSINDIHNAVKVKYPMLRLIDDGLNYNNPHSDEINYDHFEEILLQYINTVDSKNNIQEQP